MLPATLFTIEPARLIFSLICSNFSYSLECSLVEGPKKIPYKTYYLKDTYKNLSSLSALEAPKQLPCILLQFLYLEQVFNNWQLCTPPGLLVYEKGQTVNKSRKIFSRAAGKVLKLKLKSLVGIFKGVFIFPNGFPKNCFPYP